MRKLLPFLFSLALFFPASTALSENGTGYYPLQEGNSWIYRLIPGRGSDFAPGETTKTVDGSDTSDNVRYARVKHETGSGRATFVWFRQNTSGDIAMASIGSEPDRNRAYLDFDPPITVIPHGDVSEGSTWETKLPIEKDTFITSRSTVVSDDEEVRVAAGTFRNCLKVKVVTYDETGRETDVVYSWYAKGVGEVLNEQVVPKNKLFRSELVEYSVKE